MGSCPRLPLADVPHARILNALEGWPDEKNLVHGIAHDCRYFLVRNSVDAEVVQTRMSKIALCHGTYDLLHFGHKKHLEKAKEYADKLVVSVTSDKWVCKGAGRPIFSEDQRMEMIAALKFVDNVILSDHENAVQVIRLVRPNFFCKGEDYLHGDKTGNLDKERAAVEAVGGRLVIITNDIVYSSTEIITGELLRRRIAQANAQDKTHDT